VASRNSTVSTGVARGSEVAYIDEIHASLNGALGLDDVELLTRNKFGLQESCFASGVRVGISNFRYMVGLFDCLQYHLLVVDDGLCKR